jgi:hypothetical protein
MGVSRYMVERAKKYLAQNLDNVANYPILFWIYPDFPNVRMSRFNYILATM